jgi:uncharacterized MAPEG superfamily protein
MVEFQARSTHLSTVYLCLLVAGLMPIVCAGIAKWGFKDYDNKDPRAWLSSQTGFRSRANSAQANCFEAFPIFAVSVFCALNSNLDMGSLGWSSIAYVVFRCLYVVFYLKDWSTLRTLSWCMALVCVLFNFGFAIALAPDWT